MKTIRILGIETSCDDTALALVEATGSLEKPQYKIDKSVISSQLSVHKEYGGVVPGLAKREHSRNLVKVLYETLSLNYGNSKSQETNSKQIPNDKIQNVEEILERYEDLANEFKEKIVPLEKPDIDLIAVTQGPGLEPALWVGINFARALSRLWDIPIIGVDHMEGHIAVILLSENNGISNDQFSISKQAPNSKTQISNKIRFPAVALAISGGHTQLILVRDWLKYELLGETVDDAAGEAFDKVARLLGLGFPGGPEIEKLAQKGNAEAFKFPRPMINSKDYNFSFSGLKTAVRYTVEKMTEDEKTKQTANIAASFQKAVIDSVVSKTAKAAQDHKAKTVILAGGVAANKTLRENFEKEIPIKVPGTSVIFPGIKLSTDNAVMIAAAGYLRHLAGEKSDWKNMEAESGKLITENF
ncbi:MAG: tRNA (adenosine(37)-N6)-threonylcarbamoyltransferase complex transferase subunit TsaD [Candidatus Spechtbacterales bacterium]